MPRKTAEELRFDRQKRADEMLTIEFAKRIQALVGQLSEMYWALRYMSPEKLKKFAETNTAHDKAAGGNIPAWAHFTMGAGIAREIDRKLSEAVGMTEKVAEVERPGNDSEEGAEPS